MVRWNLMKMFIALGAFAALMVGSRAGMRWW